MSNKIVFKGAFLINGTPGLPIEDSVVIVEDKKITYAGKATEIPKDAEVIECKGKTIIPGLIDSHLHFSGNLTDDDTEWVMEHNYQKAMIAAVQAKECLYAGLTTVGEISQFGIHARDLINKGLIEGPRIVATGRGFCATASHGDSHKLSPEENKKSHPWGECVDGPWELRKAIRLRLRENPDAIKIWATGGGIWRWDTSWLPNYSLEEIKAVVDECHLRNIPVWSHCYGYADSTVEAGCDFLIHGFRINGPLCDKMAAQGMMLCPTINFLPAWYGTYPPPYDPKIHDQFEGKTVAEKEINYMHAKLHRCIVHGVDLTIGSDSFCSRLTPYGVTTIGEMTSFVEDAGISIMYTIQAATLNGAKALRVDDVTGTVEAGKYADLLVLSKNPLDNIRNISEANMEVIMKEGKFYKKELVL